MRRLVAYYTDAEAGSASPEGPLAVSYEEPLPLEDFFEVSVVCMCVYVCVSVCVSNNNGCELRRAVVP